MGKGESAIFRTIVFNLSILFIHVIIGVCNVQAEENPIDSQSVQESNQKTTTIIDGNNSIRERSVPDPNSEIKRLESFIFFLSISLSVAALILFFIYSINKRLQQAVNKQTSQLIQLNQDLKMQQQHIADSVTFKEQILNNIDTGIVTFNMNLLITSCNKKALEMLAFTTNLHYQFQHSDLLEVVLEHYRLHGEKEYMSHLLEINDKGKKKVIYFRMLYMFNARGEQTGYLLSMDDETEKKSLEQKLITQKKLHALGQLVAGVAHEIRNPLTSIQAFVDMLPVKYDNPKFRKVMINHLPKEVKRLNMIVTDLVDFARPRPPDKQRYSTTELISMLTFFQVTIEKNHVQFEKEINEEIIFYIDPSQIRQVLLNLLFNALDAVTDVQDKIILLKIEKEDDQTGRISIQDTGIGMSEEELNHIFEPFYTSKEKGVGLGLTLSFNLIKENNGDIFVDSIPNEGTVFNVLLPLYRMGD